MTPSGVSERCRGDVLHQRISSIAMASSRTAKMPETARSGNRCWSAAPATTPADGRDPDEHALGEVDVAVKALDCRREERDDDDRGEAGPGRNPLAEAEPEDQERDDHGSAADPEEAAECPGRGRDQAELDHPVARRTRRDTKPLSRVRPTPTPILEPLAPIRAAPGGPLRRRRHAWRRSSTTRRRRPSRVRRARCCAARRPLSPASPASPAGAARAARLIVGLDEIAYAGNHGLELLGPGDARAALDPALGDRGARRGRFRRPPRWRPSSPASACGSRTRDRSRRSTGAARRRGGGRGARARTRGSRPRRPARPALRPDGARAPPDQRSRQGDRRARAWSSGAQCSRALFGGDDRTDLDAFGALRQLARVAGSSAPSASASPPRRPRPARDEADASSPEPRASPAAGCSSESTRCCSATCCGHGPARRRGRHGARRGQRRRRQPRGRRGGAGRRRRLVADRRRSAGSSSVARRDRRGGQPRARRGAHRDQPASREPGPDRVPSAVADRRISRCVVGIAGWVWPQVAAIGAGFAIGIALAWRGREAAVAAIEERDGVRFYVEPSSALRAACG